MYHRAMETDYDPFAQVFTGRAKTRKRSLSPDDIQQLHALELPHGSQLALARDIFLFSFYAMGMPFVDIAYLKKGQLKDGYIHYARHKTGQRIQVALLPCMLRIIERYQENDSDYVFPIVPYSLISSLVVVYTSRPACSRNTRLKRSLSQLKLGRNSTYALPKTRFVA